MARIALEPDVSRRLALFREKVLGETDVYDELPVLWTALSQSLAAPTQHIVEIQPSGSGRRLSFIQGPAYPVWSAEKAAPYWVASGPGEAGGSWERGIALVSTTGRVWYTREYSRSEFTIHESDNEPKWALARATTVNVNVKRTPYSRKQRYLEVLAHRAYPADNDCVGPAMAKILAINQGAE